MLEGWSSGEYSHPIQSLSVRRTDAAVWRQAVAWTDVVQVPHSMLLIVLKIPV